MDSAVSELLEEGGIDTAMGTLSAAVALRVDEDGNILPHEETLVVSDGQHDVPVDLKATSELFVGDRQPPHFAGAPPPAYTPFFLAIERAAYEYYLHGGSKIRDKEFQQAYNDLRRRPDGAGQHPMVPHLQAAARLYMSLVDTSRAEYEAVMRRLTQSARTFAMGYTSTNYFERALQPTFGRRA